ncbi:MAG: photosynthetic complex putative assembly protein PuhB [Azospirillaceae bacterium]
MSGHDDFAFEPVRGLPEELPEGERILWQGAPAWRSLARNAFHLRALAIYFAILVGWGVIAALYDGASAAAAATGAARLGAVALVALALVGLFAWLTARTTVYTITNRRVVMRFGIALPMTINLPFRRVDGASVKHHRDGSGDIPLRLAGADRIAYLHLWPHVRPWRFSRTEPMLRGVPDASHVAEILASAVTESQSPAGRGARLAATTDRPAAAAEPAPVPAGVAGMAHAGGFDRRTA